MASSTIRFSTDASRDITGLAGGADGRIAILCNVGSFDAVLKDESASSTAGNRFDLGEDITIPAQGTAVLRYDATLSRWQCIGCWIGSPGGNIQTLLDGISTTTGALLTYEAGDWVAINPGTAGYVLTSNGAGNASTYQAIPAQPVTDGDYGDITVSVLGSVWTIDNGVVTEAKQVLADNTTCNVSITAHGYVPKAPNDATKFLDGTGAWDTVKDSDLSLSDITTNNATSIRHGFCPKLSNIAANRLDGTGAWSTVTDAQLSVSDVTSNNASTSAHGFLKKLDNDATHYMDGQGNWSALPLWTIILRDEKASGTDGGTFTSGAWQTRTLNTESYDGSNLCSLASNQFTLTAGTYEITASAPAYFVNGHKAKLYNATDAADIILGTSEYAPTSLGNIAVTRSWVTGVFTIAASKALEIRHQCITTFATYGFGIANSLGTEVYTEVKLKRIA